MEYKYITRIILILFTFGSLSSCEDLLEPDPIGVAVVDIVYIDEAGAITGINAAYSPLNTLYNSNLQRLVELASDDVYTWRAESYFKGFTTDFADGVVNSVWTNCYEGINNCNTVLNRVSNMEFLDDPKLQNIILGQAYYLRALYYFHLVRLYGDLPILLDETKSVMDATKQRSSTVEVYAQIIEDLQTAENLLPEVYTGGSGYEVGRSTKGAANALLASVYLTIEDWDNAASTSDLVISSGKYDLWEDYANNFYGLNENGRESIFEVQYGKLGAPSSNLNTFYGHGSQVLGNALYSHIPTSNAVDKGFIGSDGGGIGIVEEFESNDERFNVAISYYGLTEGVVLGSGPPDPLVNKFFMGTTVDAGASPVNFPIMRYAEVLLIKAEALNELGPNNNEAINIVNDQIRYRAGLEDLPSSVTSDQSLFREAIWKERRVETAFEAKRLFDLNRTGRLADRMAMQGVTISNVKITPHPLTGKDQYLYAIPFSETSTNPLITQNPGY